MGTQARNSFVDDVPVTDAVNVVGRYRLPSDVVHELLAVLADEPGVVVCDLDGMAPTQASLGEVFAPVAHYLHHWSGALVVVRLPVHAANEFPQFPDRLPVNFRVQRAGSGDPLAGCTPQTPLEHTRTCMLPAASVAADARAETRRILGSWGMNRMADPACVVVSELVTRSFLHSRGLLDLNLSRMGTQLRAAVGDRGAGLPAAPAAGGPGLLDDRACQLLDALTRAWGVLPTRSGGKQVWTVLDQHQARPGWYDDRVSVW